MDIKVLASGSKGNCYRVSDGETSLLLDAGIPLKRIQIGCGFKVRELSGALISHRHKDHSRAVKELIRMGVDVYAPQDVFDAEGVAGHRCHAVKNPPDGTTDLPQALQPRQPRPVIRLRSFVIQPFAVEHDVPNCGYLIWNMSTNERLLYFTDAMYIPYRFEGLDYIMAECNYSDEAIEESVRNGCIPAEIVPRIVKSHMSLEHFLDMLKANDLSRLKQVYLLHLSENNSRADEFKEAVQRATGAEVYVC